MKIQPGGRHFQLSFPERQPNVVSGEIRQAVSQFEAAWNPLEALNMLRQWQADAVNSSRQTYAWMLSEMPLRISIAPNPDWTEAEKDVFLAAQQWSVASDGLIRFQWADSVCEDGHITVSWADETVVGRDYELGHTKRELQGQRIVSAHITLIRQPVIDGYLSANQKKQRLFTTALHEFGHALGLEHSESKQDVMHHQGWRKAQLSANDIHRIKALYNRKRQLG